MIQCPKCKATLPDWQTKCQFCQADTAAVARPAAAPKAQKNYGHFAIPKWVWIAYYVIAVLWLIDGGLTLLGSIMVINAANSSSTSSLSFGINNPYLGVFTGGAVFACGFGMLIRNQFLRTCTTWVAGLRILRGLASLIFGLSATAVFGLLGLILLIFQIIGIFSSILVIYVIGETDKQADV